MSKEKDGTIKKPQLDNNFKNITTTIFTDYIKQKSNKAASMGDSKPKEHFQPFYFADYNNELGNLMLVPGANGNVVGSIPSIEKQTTGNTDPTKFSVDCHQITRMPYISLFDTKILLQHYNNTKSMKESQSASTYFGHEFERFYNKIDNAPKNPKTEIAKAMEDTLDIGTDFWVLKTKLFELLCNLINKKVDVQNQKNASESGNDNDAQIHKIPPNKWNYKHLLLWINAGFSDNRFGNQARTGKYVGSVINLDPNGTLTEGMDLFLYKFLALNYVEQKLRDYVQKTPKEQSSDGADWAKKLQRFKELDNKLWLTLKFTRKSIEGGSPSYEAWDENGKKPNSDLSLDEYNQWLELCKFVFEGDLKEQITAFIEEFKGLRTNSSPDKKFKNTLDGLYGLPERILNAFKLKFTNANKGSAHNSSNEWLVFKPGKSSRRRGWLTNSDTIKKGLAENFLAVSVMGETGSGGPAYFNFISSHISDDIEEKPTYSNTQVMGWGGIINPRDESELNANPEPLTRHLLSQNDYMFKQKLKGNAYDLPHKSTKSLDEWEEKGLLWGENGNERNDQSWARQAKMAKTGAKRIGKALSQVATLGTGVDGRKKGELPDKWTQGLMPQDPTSYNYRRNIITPSVTTNDNDDNIQTRLIEALRGDDVSTKIIKSLLLDHIVSLHSNLVVEQGSTKGQIMGVSIGASAVEDNDLKDVHPVSAFYDKMFNNRDADKTIKPDYFTKSGKNYPIPKGVIEDEYQTVGSNDDIDKHRKFSTLIECILHLQKGLKEIINESSEAIDDPITSLNLGILDNHLDKMIGNCISKGIIQKGGATEDDDDNPRTPLLKKAQNSSQQPNSASAKQKKLISLKTKPM